MKPKIIKEELLYDGFLKIKQATVEVDNGEEKVIFENSKMQKKDAVAILVWNQETQKFIFTKQFRYPIVDREEDYIIEIPAGTIEGDDSPIKTAIRELEEEIGYKVKDIEGIMEFYTSSGCSTEKIHLFMCITSNKEKVSPGGGLSKEGESIELVELTIQQIYNLMDSSLIYDAKTIIAVQEFRIRQLYSALEDSKDERQSLFKKIKDLETKIVILQSKPEL